MKKHLLTASALFGAAALVASPAFAADAPDCLAVSAAVESAVKADSSTVLAVVASKVTETPACACDVVKAAIRGTKASNDLTGQIVEAAVRAAPGQYKTIVECAVAVNAGAAAEIRAALQRVFGGKDGKGGKVVVVPDAKTMSPAVAIAFILDGITPAQGLALAMGESSLPGGLPAGQGSGIAAGMRTTASIPGGNSGSVFGSENTPPQVTPEEEEVPPPTPKPKPKPPFGGGGGGGGTPTNPVLIQVN